MKKIISYTNKKWKIPARKAKFGLFYFLGRRFINSAIKTSMILFATPYH